MPVNSRVTALKNWLCQQFSLADVMLISMNGDAGFRHYYRFVMAGNSYIAVDAPPDKSNNQAFVFIREALAEQDISVPEIHAMDLGLGYFCLSDFGDKLLADALTKNTMDACYRQAIALLPAIASTKVVNEYILPDYDRPFIEFELSIFSDWLLNEHLGIVLSEQEQVQLSLCFDYLIESALEQPKVTMHRDYHSRNIMLLEQEHLGIIDFQDAVTGPVTYDVVSLLRDCYLRWPEEQIMPLFEYFCQLMTEKFNLGPYSAAIWHRWFDLMGLQRHLKASGIFARLFHRDNKQAYLNDIPLTLSYIVDISAKYPQLYYLHQLMLTRVLPALEAVSGNCELDLSQES